MIITSLFIALMIAFLAAFIESARLLKQKIEPALDEQLQQLQSTNTPSNNFTSLQTITAQHNDKRALWALVCVKHLPPTFTGLGILGTFIGLVIGLSDLEINGSTDALKNSMKPLVSGLNTAFLTSIFGVALSLITVLVAKALLTRLEAKLEVLRETRVSKLDHKARSPEQLLTLLTDESIKQSVLLRDLIGRDQYGESRSLTDIFSYLDTKLLTELGKMQEELSGTNTKMGSLASDLSSMIQESFERTIQPHIEHMSQGLDSFLDEQTDLHRGALEGVMSSFLQQFNDSLGQRFQELSQSLDKTLAWHEQSEALLMENLARFKEISEIFDHNANLQRDQLEKTQEALEAQISIDQRRMLLAEQSYQQAQQVTDQFGQVTAQLVDQNEHWQQIVRGLEDTAQHIGGAFDELNELNRRTTAQVEQLEQTLATSSARFGQQIEHALNTTTSQAAELTQSIQSSLSAFGQEMLLTEDRYRELANQLSNGLHSGLAETFRMFDSQVSDIVDRLNGAHIRELDVLERLQNALTAQVEQLRTVTLGPTPRPSGTLQMSAIPTNP